MFRRSFVFGNFALNIFGMLHELNGNRRTILNRLPINLFVHVTMAFQYEFDFECRPLDARKQYMPRNDHNDS